jgi:hypothetical protein
MATNLENVIAEFNDWQQEVNGRGRVPAHLKQQVIELYQQYSPKELENCFGLKKATMRQWQRRANLASKSKSVDHVDFVTLTSSREAQPKHGLGAMTLTVELSNGIKLLLSGQNTTELVELTSHLAKRLNA